MGDCHKWSSAGSVLGPTLFVIYINVIYIDDTKLLRKVGTQDDCEALQKDLHTMHKWSEDWQMLFNIDKCKCLHIGYGNNRTSYQLGGTEVPTATQEKDLAGLEFDGGTAANCAVPTGRNAL